MQYHGHLLPSLFYFTDVDVIFRVILGMVDSESNIVYYRLTGGLVPPESPEVIEAKKRRRKRKFQKKKMKFVKHSEAANVAALAKSECQNLSSHGSINTDNEMGRPIKAKLTKDNDNLIDTDMVSSEDCLLSESEDESNGEL